MQDISYYNFPLFRGVNGPWTKILRVYAKEKENTEKILNLKVKLNKNPESSKFTDVSHLCYLGVKQSLLSSFFSSP